MISTDQLQQVIGGDAFGSDGSKIGSVGQAYLDNATGQPAWVTVKTGLFGGNESFVPLDDADVTAEGVRLPYDKDKIKNAPNISVDHELSESEEGELYAYYGIGGHGHAQTATTQTTTDSTTGYVGTTTGTVGHDTSGPATDDAMTRSEERVHAGVERVEAGRARLRKYIVSEQQTVTVPVTHEEARVVREPITDANRGDALSGPDLSEEEHEVVLTQERPVVSKETVPVERVRLDTETVTEQKQVDVDVRKEEIETVTDGTTIEGDARR